jgi:beta-phosphoglucomutase-like phosphatase (HAD superfamily)
MSLKALIFDVDGTLADTVYLSALAALDLETSQAVALEDSAIGVKAAKAAGLFTLVTRSAWTCNEDFSGADLVLPSLADLTLGRIEECSCR